MRNTEYTWGQKQQRKAQKAVSLTLNMKVIQALDISLCGLVHRDEATPMPHKELHYLQRRSTAAKIRSITVTRACLMHVSHILRRSVAILFLGDEMMLCTNHNCFTASYPTHKTMCIDGGGVAKKCAKEEGDDVLLIRPCLLDSPRFHYAHLPPPSCLYACGTIIPQPPVSSYQWQPDGERGSNTSRLVDWAALAEWLSL